MGIIAIKDAHDFVRMQIKKNKMGFISPDDIDRAINRGVSDWMSAVIFKYKRTGKYEYDHLLVKRKSYTVSPTTSVQAIPDDYAEALTVYVDNGGVLTEGTNYSWDDFLEIKNSYILSPSLAFPASTIYVDSANLQKVEFSPVPTSGNYTFTLVYMRKPIKALFNYTVTSTGNIAYNDSGSINIDIDDRYFSDIITRALMYIGISLRDADTASTESIKDVNQKNDER